MGKKKSQDIWEKKPTAEHYAAARVYLTLLFSDAQAAKIVRRLKAAPITRYEVKDLLRASQTYLLPEDNSQVAEKRTVRLLAM